MHFQGWPCPHCTFFNEHDGLTCQVCQQPSITPSDLGVIQSLTGWTCNKCTFYNESDGCKCGLCGNEQSNDNLADLLFNQLVLDFQPSESKCDRDNRLSNGGNHTNSDWGQTLEAAASVSSQVDTHSGAFHANVKEAWITPDSEIRIVLLGRTGVGKSATGNTILGSKMFHSTSSPCSITNECLRVTARRFDLDLQVIDTPGLYDTRISNFEITKEVIKCVAMSAPGPHVFLLVFTPDRFTEEVQSTVDHFKKLFGDGISNYIIIVFTRKDCLIHENTTIEEYLIKDSGQLRQLVNTRKNRYIAFNNWGTPDEKDEDVKGLLALIVEMVNDNKGIYTNEMFEEAEKMMKEREKKIREEYDENKERMRKRIEEKCDQQMRAIKANCEDVTDQLLRRLQELEKQQDSSGNSQDAADLRRQLDEVKAEHERELKKIRDMADTDAQMLGNDRVNYRERAREEVKESSSFWKDTLFPNMCELAKTVIPPLLQMITELVKK